MKKSTVNTDLYSEIPSEVAVIPINDGVVFPYMIIPLVIEDDNLIRLVDEALADNKILGVFTQKDREVRNPGSSDVYRTGCALLIQKMVRFPEGHIRIIGQGMVRIRIANFTDDYPFLRAEIKVIQEKDTGGGKIKALKRNVIDTFNRVVDASESYPDELKQILVSIEDPGRLADFLSANLRIDLAMKQELLEILDPLERLELLYQEINKEFEIVKLGRKIQSDVKKEIDKEQRNYYLKQKMKAIRRELGEEDSEEELEELKQRVEEKNMPEMVKESAHKEIERLKKIPRTSSEFIVARSYLDWLLELPWVDSTDDLLDIKKARKVLDRDHYNLDKVKERILEFLSVRILKGSSRGSILCFMGPPGVGKTSLGKSIASALGRKFVRISLGGVRDEAEIRGHRRTYVGSLPGRIIQGINKAGSNNPVFMLDEIDKLGSDFRGDPASALLEVLDPEQNNSFEDHYINLPFDLSRVMFITTANIMDTIPSPLLDRMENLSLPGYITSEKLEIARRFLIPKQLAENGIKKKKLKIGPDALRIIISKYTREAGVRNLERRIGDIARKVAKKLVEGKRGPYKVSRRNVSKYLGPPRYPTREMLSSPEVGVSTGMAKSSAGGVILFVEAIKVRGKGPIKITGYLGDVMKESAEAAMSFVEAEFIDELEEDNLFDNNRFHLHIPEGAVPKDGPSAGLALATSIASVATGRKVRNDVAMSGEITLTGKVLPVGAIREKVTAAYRAGIKEIILPSMNRKDLQDLPDKVKNKIKFRFVDDVSGAVSIALLKPEGRKKVSSKGGKGRVVRE